MQLATFLVPKRDKTFREYDIILFDHFKGALLGAFGGWTLLCETCGAWRNKEGRVKYDSCLRFQVGMSSQAEVRKLYALLADLAAELGQDAIWCTVSTVEGGCIEARKD